MSKLQKMWKKRERNWRKRKIIMVSRRLETEYSEMATVTAKTKTRKFNFSRLDCATFFSHHFITFGSFFARSLFLSRSPCNLAVRIRFDSFKNEFALSRQKTAETLNLFFFAFDIGQNRTTFPPFYWLCWPVDSYSIGILHFWLGTDIHSRIIPLKAQTHTHTLCNFNQCIFR